MTIHLQRTTSTNNKMGVSFGSYLHALIKIHVSEHKKSVVCIMLLFCVFLDLYNAATRKHALQCLLRKRNVIFTINDCSLISQGFEILNRY